MKNIILLTFLLAGLNACSVYKVHSDDAKMEGVPFLTKSVQLEQQTTYIVPFYEVTLVLKPVVHDSVAEKPKPVVLPAKRTTAKNNIKLNELQSSLLLTDTYSASSLSAVFNLFSDLPEFGNNADSAERVANNVVRNIVVDETLYYLNGRHHLFGSSSIDLELSSDNTLTKTNAESSSDLSGIITGLLTDVIPVSGILSKVFKLDEETKGMLESFETEVSEAKEFQIALRLDGGAHHYTFKKIVNRYEEADTPIPFSPENGRFERKEIKASPVKTDPEKQKEKNAIKIDGSIVFPDKN